jgi:hypothetical protein
MIQGIREFGLFHFVDLDCVVSAGAPKVLGPITVIMPGQINARIHNYPFSIRPKLEAQRIAVGVV